MVDISASARLNERELIRNVFEFYDKDADGTLTRDDVWRMLSVLGYEYMNEYGKDMFSPPCDFIKFNARVETIRKEDGITNVVYQLHDHIKFRIEDVFNAFTDGSHELMTKAQLSALYDGISVPKSSPREVFPTIPVPKEDWLVCWHNLDVAEQQQFLAMADARIISSLREAYTFFDTENSGRLSEETCNEIARALGEEESGFVRTLLRPPTTFDRFVVALQSLNKSLVTDIVPLLSEHVDKVCVVCWFLFDGVVWQIV